MNHEYITKTYLYNFDPLKPHFYIVKLGFTGVCIIFLISAQSIDCGICQFLVVKFSIYLNRRVFVMRSENIASILTLIYETLSFSIASTIYWFMSPWPLDWFKCVIYKFENIAYILSLICEALLKDKQRDANQTPHSVASVKSVCPNTFCSTYGSFLV